MKKTGASLGILLMALTVAISGCGGNNAGNNKEQSSDNNAKSSSASSAPSASKAPAEAEASKDPVTLTAWIMPNSPKPDADFLKTIDPYLKEHPNVSVKVTVLDWGSAWTKITTAATSGAGPDLLQLGTTWVPAIASMGGIDKLNDKVADVGGAESYLPAIWDTTSVSGQEDIYAVPWFVDARAIYYRTDAFKQAGVDTATAFKDWDSFKAALEKVNGVTVDGKKMAALGLPGKNDWNVVHNIFPWVWAAGGSVLADDNKTVTFNDEKGLQGVMYYTGLAHEGLVEKASLEKNSSQIESDFGDGKSAVIISGAWLAKNFATPKANGGMSDKAAAKNFAVAPLPAGPGGQYTFVGGSDLTVFSGSKHKEATWDLIKYLSTDEAQQAYADVSGQLPSKLSVLNDPNQDVSMKAFAEATKYGRGYPAIPQWGPTETALQKHFANIWDIVAGVKGTYNEESVKKELDAAASEVKSIVNQ
ncbi:sugar ABC transporter substrate-binding protein [Paenibacillus spiritus]|uniref:Sugar ABC transporter substrate-binding protein n=1 Tax=Paenibacillus spiritus TaxID=2496557 RepID=A0A5J5GHJ4_9BACL|nr:MULTISPECIES: sugar ABC transporter substrate-binding protein [Paenibacillus]KAA9007699.1 sugar ABC transporter substrate-binding protein [Paenibacillus spiritus]